MINSIKEFERMFFVPRQESKVLYMGENTYKYFQEWERKARELMLLQTKKNKK